MSENSENWKQSDEHAPQQEESSREKHAPEEPNEDASAQETDGMAGDSEADFRIDNDLDDLFLSPDADSEGIIEMNPGFAEDAQAEQADDSHAGAAAQAEQLSQLQAELDEVLKSRDEFKERWMRTTADIENLRKRTRREREDFQKYGHDKFALELIQAVDNLERALQHAAKSDDSSGIVDGLQMVYRQIIVTLEKYGVVAIDARGEKFDPEHHEAIQQVETTEYDTGQVVEQYQKGYFIYDRLLRPALVSVAKRIAPSNNDGISEAAQAPTRGSDEGPDSDEE